MKEKYIEAIVQILHGLNEEQLLYLLAFIPKRFNYEERGEE